MNGYIGQNTKNVEEFIEHIRERIIAAANNWREIAAAFAEAKEMYGFDSDAFKRLCKATKFSKSKASKLATIAASERLKKHEKELAAVQSWTVLYAITGLDDEQFQRLLRNKSDKLTDNDKSEIISMSMVKAAREEVTEKSSMRVYATVYIDVDAVKSKMMDGESIASLEDALRNIQLSVPYIKIETTDVCDKQHDDYVASMRRAFEVERRKAFVEAVNAKLERNNKGKYETREQFERRVLGQSKASVMDQFKTDHEEMFHMIVGDYDESVFWDRAQDRVSKNLSNIAKRVSLRGDGFEHANSVIAEIKRKEEENEEALKEWKKMSEDRRIERAKKLNIESFKTFK
jgi:hypothetical protein